MHGRIHYRSSIIEAGALARAALTSGARPRVSLRQARSELRRGEREERSYCRYFAEQHQAYREFSQLRPEEQRAYWHWRETHDYEL